MSRLDAPKRNRSGSSQSGPAVSFTSDEVLHRVLRGADAAGRLDPDDLPVSSDQSRTASSMSMVTGRVAAGEILPVLS